MCAKPHRKGEERIMQEKDIFLSDDLSEETLNELSNGKGDDEDE